MPDTDRNIQRAVDCLLDNEWALWAGVLLANGMEIDELWGPNDRDEIRRDAVACLKTELEPWQRNLIEHLRKWPTQNESKSTD